MSAAVSIALQSSMVLVAGLLAVAALRRRSAALRHAVLAATLVCAAAIPAIDAVIPDTFAPVTLPGASVAPSAQPVTPRGAASPQLPEYELPQVSTHSAWTPGRLVSGVWLLGTIVSLAGLALGLWRLARLSRRARPATSGPWVACVRRLSHGLRRPLSVRMIDAPSLVVVWGVRRPTLIVPTSAAAWPPSRIEAVVRHELAHVVRADWPLQLASEIVRAIYWFNPLVWMACAQLRRECEVACDDAVLDAGTDGAAYAQEIVAIARETTAGAWLPAPAIVRPSTLERRIAVMLDASRDRRPLSTRMRRVTGTVAVAVTIAVAALTAQSFVSLTGTIVDSSQGVLPDVTLVLTNDSTGAKYEIRTDRTGRYEFVGLPPGDYTLSAALPGFSQFTGRVTVGTQHLQQDLVMTVGTVQESITVTDGPPEPPSPERLRQAAERMRQIEEIKRKRAEAVCPGGAPAGDVRTGGNIRVPVKYRDVRPVFPESLSGTEGVVVLDTRIAADGTVTDIDVVSATHPAFADSAMAAVGQWEFDATVLNCERIVTPMTVTINFKTAK